MSLLTRTATNVLAEELNYGDWLVTATGEAGTWVACGDLVQATGEATYASMIGEPPTVNSATCAQDGATFTHYRDDFDQTGTRMNAREWVITRAKELRAYGC